jgi:hypothetical protein
MIDTLTLLDCKAADRCNSAAVVCPWLHCRLARKNYIITFSPCRWLAFAAHASTWSPWRCCHRAAEASHQRCCRWHARRRAAGRHTATSLGWRKTHHCLCLCLYICVSLCFLCHTLDAIVLCIVLFLLVCYVLSHHLYNNNNSLLTSPRWMNGCMYACRMLHVQPVATLSSSTHAPISSWRALTWP